MFVCWKSLQAQSPVLYRQEWKRGNHKHLGQVRAYEPKPPASSATDVDPNQYPLKLIKLDYDPNPSLKGWNKFRISIPPAVRARYIDDQVFGEDWSNILKDFDQKPFDWIIHFLMCYLLKFNQFCDHQSNGTRDVFPTLGSGFPHPLFLLGLFSYMGPAPCISPKNVASQFHLYDYILLVYVLHILYIYIYNYVHIIYHLIFTCTF